MLPKPQGVSLSPDGKRDDFTRTTHAFWRMVVDGRPAHARRHSLMIFVVTLIMVAATPYFGPEIKGARRWLVLLGVNIQPSEFIKPAFVIIVAWLFGASAKRPDMPANTFSLILLLTVIALLVVQPDLRQAILIAG